MWCRRIIWLVLVLLSALHPLAPLAAPAARQDSERPVGPSIDIARVVPYPDDFDSSIPGLGFLDGRFFSIEEVAVRAAASASESALEDIQAAREQLERSGWLQRYESRLAAPLPEDEGRFSVQISSFVVEYATEQAAHAAFIALTRGESAIEAAPIADESMLTTHAGVTPDTETPYKAAKLIYRVGPLIGSIVYADLLDQEPNLELLTSAGRAVVARAHVVSDRLTVPLGSMALWLSHAGVFRSESRVDRYVIRDGTVTPLLGEGPSAEPAWLSSPSAVVDAFSSTASGSLVEFGSERSTSVYALPVATPSHDLATPGQHPETGLVISEPAQVTIRNSLLQFLEAADAEAWIAQQQASLANQEAQVREIQSDDRFGAASAIYAWTTEGDDSEPPTNGWRMYARAGTIATVLDVASRSEIPLDVARQLMTLQVGCMMGPGCFEPVLRAEDASPTAPAPVVVAPTPIPIAPPPPAEVVAPTAAPVEEPPPPPTAIPTPMPNVEPTPAPTVVPGPSPEPGATPTPAPEPTPTPVPAPVTPSPPTPTAAPEPTPTFAPPPADVTPTAPSGEPTPPAQSPTPAAEPTPVPAPPPSPTPAAAPVPTEFVEPAPATVVPTEEPDDDREDRRSRRDRDDNRKDRDRRD